MLLRIPGKRRYFKQKAPKKKKKAAVMRDERLGEALATSYAAEDDTNPANSRSDSFWRARLNSEKNRMNS